MNTERKKLVYILPEYRKNSGTHFYYNIELVRALKDTYDIALVIEKGERPEGIENARVLRSRTSVIRAFEMVAHLWSLKRKGYRTFWTHYSFTGGILAPYFGKSFYWNCGMPWLYTRSWFEERIFRTALRHSMLVTGTEGMKHMYAREYELDLKKISVLPNWIDHARFSFWARRKSEARDALKLPHDKKIVLFLHRLSHRKGAHLIMPVADILAEDPSILMLVCGTGPLEKDIEGSNVMRVGEVAQERVPEYLAASDVFFMPSQEEGVPHSLLEAMASGLPVVATDVGGVREIVPEDFQDFILDQNPEALAGALLRILKDEELRVRLGESGKTWVSQYSLEFIVRHFRQILADQES